MNQAVLERFYTLAEQDGAMQAYARDNTVLVQFKQTDTGQDSFLWFERGQLKAGMSLPEGKKAEVLISLKSDQFEALLAGRLNPYFAAMNGKIRVDGDVLKATDLLKIIKDIVRVYAALKNEIQA